MPSSEDHINDSAGLKDYLESHDFNSLAECFEAFTRRQLILVDFYKNGEPIPDDVPHISLKTHEYAKWINKNPPCEELHDTDYKSHKTLRADVEKYQKLHQQKIALEKQGSVIPGKKGGKYVLPPRHKSFGGQNGHSEGAAPQGASKGL